ncbi:MAG: hypothetical protein A4S09_08585 [Proteobacteria bacterium SG_bin7]|nr:MAG: hypothetical protein A4S09_08585 [Proteobacteria bacterium SG_bin7]
MIVRPFFLALILSSYLPAFCNETATLLAAEEFAQGAKQYLAKEYKESAESFKRAAAKNPTTDIFLNLGLAEFQLGHFGWAMAYWRRALYLSPWNSSAKEAIEHLQSQNKIRRGIEDGSITQKIHSSFLQYISLNLILLISLSLMAFGFWKLFAFLGERKRANASGALPPVFPMKVGMIIGVFILSSLVATVKYFDTKTIRATIVVSSVHLRTGPTEESANVTEVFEGQEVVVQRLDKNWLQVTHAGRTTGWIDRKTVELNSGDVL